MSKRKTVSIDSLKANINARIERSPSEGTRRALASLLEGILMDAGQYRGFNYLYWSREGGYEAWVASGLEDTMENHAEKSKFIHGTLDGHDDGRVFYY